MLNETNEKNINDKIDKEASAYFDPLSEFNILSYVTWNDETLKLLNHEWNLRGKDGLIITEFIHVLLKVFPKQDKRNPSQKKQWVRKLVNFFNQVDYKGTKKVQWESFLSFITACCSFDREKTRVDTVVQYHFEKEIVNTSGNFTVLKFIYDHANDYLLGFNANGTVQIYSPSSLTQIKTIPLHGKSVTVVYDGTVVPERSLLAITYPTGIQIISTLQGSSLAQNIETCETSHFCIMYEPTTHSIFTGSESGKLHCWKADKWNEKPSRMNWKCSQTVKINNGGAITCLGLIPNSLCFVSGDDRGQLIVWDKKNVRLMHKIQAHKAQIHTIVHSESLHAIITAAYETTVCIWNPFIPFLMSKIECPTGIVTAMTCLPDSSHLIMADRNGNLHIVNSRTMAIVQTFSISPFGQFTSQVNLTQTVHKQLTKSLLTNGSFPITSLMHCGQRKRFVLGGRFVRFYEYEENIQPMLSDKTPVKTALMNNQYHTIATCSGSNIRHWEVATGLMRCVFRSVAPSDINCMCVDAAQTVLFLACQGGEVLALHFPTSTLLHNIGQHGTPVTSIHYIPGPSVIVTSGWSGTVSIWSDSDNGKLIDLLTDKKDDILCLAVDNKSMILASGSDKGEIYIWDLLELKLKAILHPHQKETEILYLTFIEDSNLLISTDAEGYISFWTVRESGCALVTQLPNYYIESQISIILSICITDGFLVTGDNCGEVRLWDISQLIGQYPHDKNRLVTVQTEINEFQNTISQRGMSVRCYTSTVNSISAKSSEMPVGSFQLIIKWKAHHSSITSLSSFMANGEHIILSSSNDCCVSCWEMKTGICKGFLQSNPSLGLTERKWLLKYDSRKDLNIDISEINRLIEEADTIETPPSSPSHI